MTQSNNPELQNLIWPDLDITDYDWTNINDYDWKVNDYEPTKEQTAYIKSILQNIENLKNK